MFLSRDIDINLCQNYTKMCICKYLYKVHNIKQIIFRNQSENDDIPEEPEKLRCAPIII